MHIQDEGRAWREAQPQANKEPKRLSPHGRAALFKDRGTEQVHKLQTASGGRDTSGWLGSQDLSNVLKQL